jgi:hypothetical protein
MSTFIQIFCVLLTLAIVQNCFADSIVNQDEMKAKRKALILEVKRNEWQNRIIYKEAELEVNMDFFEFTKGVFDPNNFKSDASTIVKILGYTGAVVLFPVTDILFTPLRSSLISKDLYEIHSLKEKLSQQVTYSPSVFGNDKSLIARTYLKTTQEH